MILALLTVIAIFTAKPGSGDQAAAILARHAGESRSEPGCIEFVVNRSEKDPNRFVLYERYLDDAAFEAHRSSEHFDRNIEKGVVPLLADRAWGRYERVEPPQPH